MQPLKQKVEDPLTHVETTQEAIQSSWKGHVVKLEFKSNTRLLFQVLCVISGFAAGIFHHFGMFWPAATACTCFFLSARVVYELKLNQKAISLAYSNYPANMTTSISQIEKHQIGEIQNNECRVDINSNEYKNKTLELRDLKGEPLANIKIDSATHLLEILPLQEKVTLWKWNVSVDGQHVDVKAKAVHCEVSKYFNKPFEYRFT